MIDRYTACTYQIRVDVFVHVVGDDLHAGRRHGLDVHVVERVHFIRQRREQEIETQDRALDLVVLVQVDTCEIVEHGVILQATKGREYVIQLHIIYTVMVFLPCVLRRQCRARNVVTGSVPVPR